MKSLFTIALLFLHQIISAQTFTNNIGGGIPDNNTYVSFPITVSGLTPATINQTTFGLEMVTINVNHPYDADLRIKLEAPDGTLIVLTSFNGGGGQNYTNTNFIDSASAAIAVGSAPFTGDFKPTEPLANANNNQNANGVWKLNVRDQYAAESGNVISWSIKFGNNPAELMQFDSSNLPVVVINTNGQGIQEGIKITADMGIIYNGPGAINYLTDPFNSYNGKIGIEIRGQSSAGFDQKQYNVETRDVNGNSVDSSILGMPAESDWVLYAPYDDKSLMRNVITYRLAREMGRWAPRTEYCEVVIDGQYMGVYVFMEKIKRDDNRVNIKKLTSTSNSGDSLSGGYIFKIDKDQPNFYSTIGPPASTGGQTIGFSYQYPKPTTITTAQANYIQSFVLDSFEMNLMSPNFQDPINGYRKYVSIKSFVDYFLINEISKNVDGYRLSSFFHKDRNSVGGQLKAGPVWDFNLAWHNADYCEGDLSTGWAYKFNTVCGGDYWQIPFWWDRFMMDTVFQNKTYCRWQELRTSLLDTTILFAKIDSDAFKLEQAQQRHFTKYAILGAYVWPNPSPLANTYAEEIRYTKDWIVNRINWLDANILPYGECQYTGIKNNSGNGLSSTVYPNPFNEKVAISINFPKDNYYSFELYNVLGEKVYALARSFYYADEYNLVFDFSQQQLKSGVYVMKISSDKMTQSIKLVKQ